MKKLFVAIMVFGSTGVFAQNETVSKSETGPVISFDQKAFDFGDLVQGDKVEHTFSFTNTGDQPLLITNVQVTCGCTTPKGWPREPINPGDQGEITVAFNSTAKIGRQNKPVTIVSNASNPEGNRLFFSANVLPKPTSAEGAKQ